MGDQMCPSCGAEVPRETGQHAETPSAGVVICPNCGAEVTLDRPGAEPEATQAPRGDAPRAAAAPPGEATGEDAFSGEETVEGVMNEIREKEGE
jgi:hypothetical protein